MRLYHELVHTYTLLSPRDEYVEEAAVYQGLFRGVLGAGPLSLLELGAGAGHNASWFEDVTLTLTDLSPEMLSLAAHNNPTARCQVGDMRYLRLNETFDVVFVHDALCYLRTEADLRAVLETAFVHLRPGGVALFAPDEVEETFAVGVECGGSDGEGEGVRYLEWSWQRPGQTHHYVVDYTIVHRVGEGPPQVYQDRHEGCFFSRATWMSLLASVGFTVSWSSVPDVTAGDLFLARRPEG